MEQSVTREEEDMAMARYTVIPSVEHYDPNARNRLGRLGAYVRTADLVGRFSVRGKSIGEAAQTIARRIGGRTAVAERVTGDADLSGMFQTYKPLPDGALTSVGYPFHVQEGR